MLRRGLSYGLLYVENVLEDNDMPKFNQIEDMSDEDIIKNYL